ncbi:c-type cytochrome [Herbaspirillum sp.]|uniref:c-type cytochrome n=1 Tax=Herbaspirillum sp. TaxID=1890675 RepID=UPI001B00D5A3|nr:c-type cytochrome [Herbaspirillum sp.]MBO9536385.1 cytochrome c5 family protein [Herbaspirillum sp.]
MSSAHHDQHESAIKTPKQLIAAVVAGFLVPIVCIVLLVQYVTNGQKTGAGSDGQSPEMIAARIKPVADDGFTFRDASTPKQLQSGEDVFKSTCAACHAAGVAGAPKVGDAGAWKARIAEGYDQLVSHAINGLRAMPPKGGNPDLDDVEIQRTVVYMANQSGAKFKEPEVKAPAAPAAGDAPAAPTPAK